MNILSQEHSLFQDHFQNYNQIMEQSDWRTIWRLVEQKSHN